MILKIQFSQWEVMHIREGINGMLANFVMIFPLQLIRPSIGLKKNIYHVRQAIHLGQHEK